MSSYKHFKIQNEGSNPFTFKIKAGSRCLETWDKLRSGPVPAPALTRRSDHILHFRQSGVLIETEMRKQPDNSQERFGIYHLKSVVTLIAEGAQ
jgi:hypothetical protein